VSAPLAALLAAVRKACLPGLWSQGVKLARDGAVFDEAKRGDTLTARVRVPALAVAPSVTLFLGDDEWTCDCGSPVDPCAHVAAAAIALGQRQDAGEGPRDAARSAAPSVAHMRYRLERQNGALALRRMIVRPDGTEEQLRIALSNPAARGLVGGALSPTHEDLAVDRIVGGRQPGWFPADRVADIFGELATADVRLDDETVRTSREVIVPRAFVRDLDDGVVLVIERDPRVSDVVVAGIGRSGDTLHALGEMDLSGPRLERLPLKRRFSQGGG
jgi:hypothetical protein